MKARRVVIALTAILLLSVALNLLLFVAARKYYLQRNAASLDPLGLSFYPAGSDPQPPTAAQLRVVFFGDSRAYDWPAPSGLEGFEFVNRGIGNQTTAQVLSRFDAHVAPLPPQTCKSPALTSASPSSHVVAGRRSLPASQGRRSNAMADKRRFI